jgi:hypothetical protein
MGGMLDDLLARDRTLLLGAVALFAASCLACPIVEGLTAVTSPAVVEQAEGSGGLDSLAGRPMWR